MRKFKRKDQAPLCACGCGERVKRNHDNSKWNCFVHGHNWNNRKHTDKTRTKMSVARKKQDSLTTGMSGKKHSEEKNCHPNNLITVCISCNSRANSNREYWTSFYQEIMTRKYKYEYSDAKKAA